MLNVKEFESEVKNHLEQLQTNTAKERYAAHSRNLIRTRLMSLPQKELFKEYGKTLNKLEDIRSSLLPEVIEEIKNDALMKLVNQTLSPKKLIKIQTKSDSVLRAYQNGLVKWNQNDEEQAAESLENQKQAAKEFENAGLLYLAAEAYGRLELYDEELRLHRIIRSSKENLKDLEKETLAVLLKHSRPLRRF
jgi:hypothetical protein